MPKSNVKPITPSHTNIVSDRFLLYIIFGLSDMIQGGCTFSKRHTPKQKKKIIKNKNKNLNSIRFY